MGVVGWAQRRAPYEHGVGPSNGQHGRGVLRANLAHPWHCPGVVEAHHQSLLELDMAADPNHRTDQVDPAYDIKVAVIHRHEVVHLGHPSGGLPTGYEHKGVSVISTTDFGLWVFGPQTPTTM